MMYHSPAAVNVCGGMLSRTSQPARSQLGLRLHQGRDVHRYRVVVTDLTESGNEVEMEVFAAAGLPIDLVTADETGRAGLLAATTGAHALMVQFATIDR